MPGSISPSFCNTPGENYNPKRDRRVPSFFFSTQKGKQRHGSLNEVAYLVILTDVDVARALELAHRSALFASELNTKQNNCNYGGSIQSKLELASTKNSAEEDFAFFVVVVLTSSSSSSLSSYRKSDACREQAGEFGRCKTHAHMHTQHQHLLVLRHPALAVHSLSREKPLSFWFLSCFFFTQVSVHPPATSLLSGSTVGQGGPTADPQSKQVPPRGRACR